MFTLEQIEAIGKKGIENKWTYPQLFDALKEIGVERYEVNVPTHEINYFGQGSSVNAPIPASWKPITAAKVFNAEGVKTAIKRAQARQITYPQFLEEIAASGIAFYRVDMKPRLITYHGPGKDKHVEPVPPSV